MNTIEYHLEEIGPEILTGDNSGLSDDALAELWEIFIRIGHVWEINTKAGEMRSRWLDMIQSRMRKDPVDYSAEYMNAVTVWRYLEAHHSRDLDKFVFFDTIVTDSGSVRTRLDHAKFFVINDFIKCFVLLSGFKDFGGKNYKGFMGGSRRADEPPIRTGDIV